jgi:hypothetical protein
MNMNRSIMVLALSLMIFEVGCSVSFVAPKPQANFVAQVKLNGTPQIEVTGAVDAEQCHSTPGIKDICVTGLKRAMQAGLGDVLAEYAGGSRSAAQDAFGALEAAVLERISTAINEAAAKVRDDKDEPAAADAPAS